MSSGEILIWVNENEVWLFTQTTQNNMKWNSLSSIFNARRYCRARCMLRQSCMSICLSCSMLIHCVTADNHIAELGTSNYRLPSIFLKLNTTSKFKQRCPQREYEIQTGYDNPISAEKTLKKSTRPNIIFVALSWKNSTSHNIIH